MINDFLFFLEQWDRLEVAGNVLIPISMSTRTGLKVSLNGALRLLNYLHDECNYIYLVTSRLSIDLIEVIVAMYLFYYNHK